MYSSEPFKGKDTVGVMKLFNQAFQCLDSLRAHCSRVLVLEALALYNGYERVQCTPFNEIVCGISGIDLLLQDLL